MSTDEAMETTDPKMATQKSKDDPSNASMKRKQTHGVTTIAQHTLRKPRWTYLHLSLNRSPPVSTDDVPLDAITARKHLTSALEQFLGITGTAIPIDFLKLDGYDFWVRVPREDASAMIAALGGWVGSETDAGGDATVNWRVKGWDNWLARLVGGDGMDLFSG